MNKVLRDLQPKFTPQVEKTNTVLPVDEANLESPSAQPLEPQNQPEGIKKRIFKFLRILGPGVITGASDDDPSGIGTYSVAGAQFGYQTLWLALATYPLSAAVQEVCARIGLVTGHGLAAVTKKHYGRFILFIVALLLVGANTINIGADIQAMSATLLLIFPEWDFAIVAVCLTAFILFCLVFLPYRTFASYLKFTALVLFAYIIVAFFANVDWNLALRSLLIPSISLQPTYIMTLVGILGTTISPYMFFWQASEEVEEEVSKGLIRKDDPKAQHPQLLKIDRRIIKNMYLDVNLGMFYSETIMFFIIVSSAASIFSQGGATSVTDLSLDQLANVLRPLVGDTAFLLFAIGIVGIGLLAIPVLAGSASYAISELFGWKEGLNKNFREAKGFYAVIILATLVGLALNFIGIRPVAALYYTAVLNGVVAVPLLFIIWRIGNNRKILGEHTSGWLSNTLVIATIIFMAAAVTAMFYYQ